MLTQTVKIDRAGRIVLPKPLLDASGIAPDAEVVIELTEIGIVIRPKRQHAPITSRIAGMDLPVADWEQMERDIEGIHQLMSADKDFDSLSFITRIDPLTYP